MPTIYFTRLLGIVHLVRFLSLALLLVLIEIKFASCGASLNEFLGFNYYTILFFYIIVWVAFAFDIYFLLNRLFGSVEFQARKSAIVLHVCLSLAFLLGSCFTLYAMIDSRDGHVITQQDFGDPLQRVIPLTSTCNRLRLIGVLFGCLISVLYSVALVLVHRS